MNTKLLSAGLLLALALSLGLLGKLGWSNYELRQAKEKINSQLMQSQLEIGRAKTELGDSNARIDSLSMELQEEVSALKASVTRYAELEAEYKVLKKSKGEVRIEYYPGETVEIPCPDLNLVRGLLYEAVTHESLAPVKKLRAMAEDDRLTVVCIVEPIPNNTRSIPFQIGYSLHFRVGGKLIETKTPSGAINHFVELYEMDKTGKNVGKFELSKFEVIVDDATAPHFMWWAPRVDVGILGGWGTSGHPVAGGSLGFSVMAYGRTVNDLTWRFPRLSMDLSGNLGIGLTPVMYNIGEPLPIISNVWVGPHFMWGFGSEAMLGVFMGGVL